MAPHVMISASEKSASNASNSPASMTAGAQKLRSCVVCRSRKVRCDKLSPCSNCRRANIACIFPSGDRPPRWARRLEQRAGSNATPNTTSQDMERIRTLESLVNELSAQLKQANAAAHSAGVLTGMALEGSNQDGRDVSRQGDASHNTNASNLQKPFGMLVLQDTNQSRYVSSEFWSRVNDEVCWLIMCSWLFRVDG